MNNLVRALALALMALAACTTPQAQPQPRNAVFIQSEYDAFNADGTGSIAGQAFLKTRGGDVIVGAGNQVFLNPVTSYSTEWFQRDVIAGEHLGPPDERARPYLRTTVADATGSFRFDKLPAGDYYLGCKIVWEYATSYGASPTGGTARARVTVRPDEETRAIVTLTDKDIEESRKAQAAARARRAAASGTSGPLD